MTLSQLLTQPWAITEDGYRDALLAVKSHNDLFRFKGAPEDALVARAPLGSRATLDDLYVVDGVAVIPVVGGLTQFSYWSGDRASYEWIGGQLAMALDDGQVEGIMLVVDSPGGEVAGCEALSASIFEARSVKPVMAFVPGRAASAGYWLASSASRIVATRTSVLGSIGILFTTFDFSKMDEAMGIEEITIVSSQSPGKDTDASTDEGRARIQEMVDAMAEVFIADVARGRGVSAETVVSDFGQGWIRVGEDAIAAGMADELGTLEQTISSAGASAPAFPPLAAGGAKENTMQVNTDDITVELLAEHCPKVVAAIGEAAAKKAVEKAKAEMPDLEQLAAENQTKGAESERERILGIEEAGADTGLDELVAELVADPKVTVEAAKGRLFEATKAENKGRLDAFKEDGKETDPPKPGGGEAPSESEARVARAIEQARAAGVAVDAGKE